MSGRAKKLKSDAILPALQQRSKDNRDRLLQAGAKSFATLGYEKTRVVDLADAVGISVGVFYQRFKGKREFFDALEDDVIRRGRERWRTFFLETGNQGSAQDYFERFVKELAQTINDDIGFFRGMITLGHHDKSVPGKIAELDISVRELLMDSLIEKGFLAAGDVSKEQFYMAYSMAAKTLLIMLLIAVGPLGGLDPATHRELARMLVSYLGIKETD